MRESGPKIKDKEANGEGRKSEKWKEGGKKENKNFFNTKTNPCCSGLLLILVSFKYRPCTLNNVAEK